MGQQRHGAENARPEARNATAKNFAKSIQDIMAVQTGTRNSTTPHLLA
jgi:hypothetical protein